MRKIVNYNRGPAGKTGKKRPSIWGGYKVIVIIIVSLSLIQLFFSDNISTLGQNLTEIDKNAANVKQENAKLSADLGRYYSLSWVAQEGNLLGLVRIPSKMVFVSPKSPVALR